MEKNTNELTPAEKWEQATFANNFIFCKVLSANPDLCKEILELLLEIEIDHVEVRAEESFIIDYNSRGIRMDVYVKSDGKVYDIEMQTTDTKDLPERARYYQGMMDVDQLKSGEDFSRLKDSYVIFISLVDIFQKGLPVYTFKKLCLQDKELEMGERTWNYWFIPKNCDKLLNEEQKDFLKFIITNSGTSGLVSKLQQQVALSKTNNYWRSQYMIWENCLASERRLAREEGLAEGFAEGLEKGLEKGLAKGQKMDALEKAVIAVTKLNSPVETVSELFNVSLEELKQALGEQK